MSHSAKKSRQTGVAFILGDQASQGKQNSKTTKQGVTATATKAQIQQVVKLESLVDILTTEIGLI
jgi:hypothetical protein